MELKPKPCSGINKAKGFKGCGKESLYRQNGLCPSCLWEFYQIDERGKVIYQKSFLSKVSAKMKANKKSEFSKMRENIKCVPELKKYLEKIVNKICCEIDKEVGCISCGGITTPQCGHYHTVASNGSIRYNLHNLHKQDYNCNCAKGGNIHQYDLGLIERYGKSYWEYVKFDIVKNMPLIQFKKLDLIDYIKNAKECLKWLKNKPYSKDSDASRMLLRDECNELIGIYPNR